jgi:hypothetical protein
MTRKPYMVHVSGPNVVPFRGVTLRRRLSVASNPHPPKGQFGKAARAPKPAQKPTAREWLEGFLEPGVPALREEALRAGMAAGYTRRQLLLAANKPGIWEGPGDPFTWRLDASYGFLRPTVS